MTNTLLTGNLDTVRDELIAIARHGDHRARPADINGNRGVLTPHTTTTGTLDADDLAAQAYALAHGLTSTDGTYTGGHFTTDAQAHFVPAPPDPAAFDSLDQEHFMTTFTQREAESAVANGLIDRSGAPQDWESVSDAVDIHLGHIEREQERTIDREAIPSEIIRRILDTMTLDLETQPDNPTLFTRRVRWF